MTTPTSADRSTGRGLALEALWRRGEAASAPARGGDLPVALAARYGPRLAIPLRRDRPTIVANFVESLDGVVALNEPGGPTGGGEISGFFEPDRFVMGLLRALADVVIVGAGTVRNAPSHVWTPRRVARAHAADYEAWRRELQLSPQPTTLIVTARADLDPRHPALDAPDVPAVILTTPRGAAFLAGAGLADHVRIEVRDDGDRVSPRAIVDAVHAHGGTLAVCEGGPHLLADLVGAGLVDELFLTIAPQIVGRSRTQDRLAFVEGFTEAGGANRWADLISVHRAGDHLFLRHRLRAHPGEP